MFFFYISDGIEPTNVQLRFHPSLRGLRTNRLEKFYSKVAETNEAQPICNKNYKHRTSWPFFEIPFYSTFVRKIAQPRVAAVFFVASVTGLAELSPFGKQLSNFM
jgi:hypothetical protein